MPLPRIVFVEGPTGAGKGYFIDNFISSLKIKRPHLRIKVLEAKTWALKHATSEDRKYTNYTTEKDKINTIFEGHLDYIQYLTELIDEDKADLIISDRSFLSFITYNAYNLHKSERDIFIEVFNKEYAKLGLSNVPTLTVQLISGLPTNRTVNLLIERLKSRNDSKELDPEWVRTLIYNYSVFPAEKILPTTNHEKVTSSDTPEIVSGYFDSSYI